MLVLHVHMPHNATPAHDTYHTRFATFARGTHMHAHAHGTWHMAHGGTHTPHAACAYGACHMPPAHAHTHMLTRMPHGV
jgi:hypothetical protein